MTLICESCASLISKDYDAEIIGGGRRCGFCQICGSIAETDNYEIKPKRLYHLANAEGPNERAS